jgi:hypothetical protein
MDVVVATDDKLGQVSYAIEIGARLVGFAFANAV